MKASRTKLAGTIADHTLKQGLSHDYAKEIAAYLLTERRVGELDSLLRDVQSDWAKQGYVEVIARTAHPLEAANRESITRQIQLLVPEAKKVVVTEVPDATVLGGVQLFLADRQLDLSVEAKLNKFKQLTSAGKE